MIESRRRWADIVARLADHGVLGPGFVGAHGVWLGDDDIRMLADAGAAVAHNPGSNLRLGGGIAPVRELLDRGVAVGLGTDGSACADDQNLFEALRIASVISTIRFPHETSRWLDAATVWDMATSGSARVLGQSGDLGAVAPGPSWPISSCCARTRSSSSRSPIRSLRWSTPRRAPAWTRCWSAAAWSWSGAASPRWTRTGSTPAPRRRRTASASTRGGLGACRAAGALRGRGVPGGGRHPAPDFNRYAAPTPTS